ncbi:MAG: hypothetical protein J3K34DRAFT_404665, partial [Monoraphidium minutum]
MACVGHPALMACRLLSAPFYGCVRCALCCFAATTGGRALCSGGDVFPGLRLNCPACLPPQRPATVAFWTVAHV